MSRPKHPVIHHAKPRAGFSILELLIAVALAGIVLTIALIGGRQILTGQEQRSALTTVQQSIWQGATAAAARGRQLELVIADPGLVLRFEDDQSVLRRFELPDDVAFNVDDDTTVLLTFTPPGKLDEASLAALPAPFVLTTKQGDFVLTLSVIGEVRFTRGSS